MSGVPRSVRRRVEGRGLVLTEQGKEVAAFARDLDERPQRLAARVRGEAGPERVVLAAGTGARLCVIGEGLRAYSKRRSPRVDLVTLEQLAGERLVLPPEGRPHRAIIDAALRSRGVRVVVGAIAQGWELTLRLGELGFGIAIVNGCCRVPRGLVARRVPELPGVPYVAFTRARVGDAARALVLSLVERGEDWRRDGQPP